jgi:hypothetical protein
MASWYRGAIAYQREDEAGRLITVNEQYLVDSVSFSEAEARLYKQIVTDASDFQVKTITKMRLTDLFAHDEGEQWFKAKVIYYSVDEKSGKEKKIVNFMLVNAQGIQQGLDRVNENMRNFLIPYEITDIVLTQILDVFPYTAEEDKGPEIPANLRPLADVMAERKAAEYKEEDGDSGEE